MSSSNPLRTLEVEQEMRDYRTESKDEQERSTREDVVVIRGSITVSF